MTDNPIYFYTMEWPHRYTPGPIIITTQHDCTPIGSLEAAKRHAEAQRVDTRDESRVETTYGVMYK